jgi:hypothetical protein
MKTQISILLFATALPLMADDSITNSPQSTNSPESKADEELESFDRTIQEQIYYFRELRRQGLHEYADMNISGPSPSLKEMSREITRFGVFLQQNYKDQKRVEDYIDGTVRTQIFWLLKIQLAQWHYAHGKLDEAQAICDDFSQYCADKKTDQKAKSQQSAGGDSTNRADAVRGTPQQ